MAPQTPNVTPARLIVATWVAELHRSGLAPDHAGAAAACDAVLSATTAEVGNKAGEALVEVIDGLLDDESPESIAGLARTLFGDRITTAMGEGSRDARTTRIRKYQFSSRLPWLARIVERRGDGSVSPGWLIVQGCTDEVHVLDPNPWDDIDEERNLPLADFQVLWELDACSAVAVS